MAKIYATALRRAAEILGGKSALQMVLQIPMTRLDSWLDGSEQPPMGAFLKAVDVLASAQPEWTGLASDKESRRSQLDLESDLLLASLERTMRRTRETRESILATSPEGNTPRKPVSVLSFLRGEFQPADGRVLVETALDAAVCGTGADMGNLQLSGPEGLVIVAQRGFGQPFLDFFACVKTEGSCGAASRHGGRVIVSDVRSDPIFAGDATREVMEAARARACQSTPLFGASGEIVGMLNTHYEKPWQPGADELQVLDTIAERTAYWLNGGPI